MTTIAFFGLGNMGVPIVKNLLAAGFIVKSAVHNGNMNGPNKVAAYGAQITDSIEAAVKDADIIMSIVPDDAAVKEIYLNEAMHQYVKENAVIIEMTSCSAETVIAVQKYYDDKQVKVIDAPVTGAKIGAETGNLTILGAGEAETFQKVQPVLDAISKKVYQLGPVGNGKFVKAVTNLMGAVNLAMAGEICRIVKKQGMDLGQFFAVAQESAGGSTQFTRNFNRMVQEDFTTTFALKLLRKDMDLALDMADKELSLPISNFVYQIYEAAAIYDNEDCSAIVKADKVM